MNVLRKFSNEQRKRVPLMALRGLWIMIELEQEVLLAVVLVMHVVCLRRVGVSELRRLVKIWIDIGSS